jgi:hypothetical protein
VSTARDGREPTTPPSDRAPRSDAAPPSDRTPRGDRALRGDRARRADRPRTRPGSGVSYVAVLRASGRALDAPGPRRRPLLITDGPFAETREHLG